MKLILRLLLLSVSSFWVTSCAEEGTEISCGKWNVEINNPDATARVENGKLIVDIENPESDKDVRLIQTQDPSVNTPDVALSIAIAEFSSQGVGGRASRDAQISASFAYEAAPNTKIIESIYGADRSAFRVGNEEVFYRMEGNGRVPDELIFSAVGSQAAYERGSQTFPISATSIAPKVIYVDFGINPSFTRQSPTQSIHFEVDLIIFEKYTDNKRPMQLVSGYNATNYGFFQDSFDCNSLIK